MKQIILAVLFCVLLQGCGNNASEKANKQQDVQKDSIQMPVADSLGNIVKVGDIAPDFEFTYTDGKTAKLSDYKGKVVMLQFTASWCSICRKEMPYIESDIWQKHKDNQNFVLIGIDRDEPLETVVEFGKSVNITYPLALDPGADIFAKYALRDAGITRNVLIDKEGKIVMLTRKFKTEEFNKLVETIGTMLE